MLGPSWAFDTCCWLTFVPRRQFSSFPIYPLHPPTPPCWFWLALLDPSSLPQMCFGTYLNCSSDSPCQISVAQAWGDCSRPPVYDSQLCWLWPVRVESTLGWKVDWMEHASPILSTLTLKSVSWHHKLSSILKLKFKTHCSFCWRV